MMRKTTASDLSRQLRDGRLDPLDLVDQVFARIAEVSDEAIFTKTLRPRAEAEARAYANRLLSKLDADQGEAIRNKSLDTQTFGVAHQAELREQAAANDGYLEDNLWTGIGRARSGCGAAIVGDPDQVLAKINAYREVGIEAFILSGYPHINECDMFARYVLPKLEHGRLEI